MPHHIPQSSEEFLEHVNKSQNLLPVNRSATSILNNEIEEYIPRLLSSFGIKKTGALEQTQARRIREQDFQKWQSLIELCADTKLV